MTREQQAEYVADIMREMISSLQMKGADRNLSPEAKVHFWAQLARISKFLDKESDEVAWQLELSKTARWMERSSVAEWKDIGESYIRDARDTVFNILTKIRVQGLEPPKDNGPGAGEMKAQLEAEKAKSLALEARVKELQEAALTEAEARRIAESRAVSAEAAAAERRSGKKSWWGDWHFLSQIGFKEWAAMGVGLGLLLLGTFRYGVLLAPWEPVRRVLELDVEKGGSGPRLAVPAPDSLAPGDTLGNDRFDVDTTRLPNNPRPNLEADRRLAPR